MNKKIAIEMVKLAWADSGIIIENDFSRTGGGRYLEIINDDKKYLVDTRHKNPSGSLIMHLKPEVIEQISADAKEKGLEPALSVSLTINEEQENYLLIATYSLKHFISLTNDNGFYPFAIENVNFLIRYQNSTNRNKILNAADIFSTKIML